MSHRITIFNYYHQSLRILSSKGKCITQSDQGRCYGCEFIRFESL